MYPLSRQLLVAEQIVGGILEGVEAGNQDVGQHQEAVVSRVVLVEAAQNSSCNQLAEGCAGKVDILAIVQVRLFMQKLDPVHKQAVYCRWSIRRGDY